MQGELSLAAGQWAGDRAVPCSILKPGGEAALLLASPDGAADPPCRPAPTPWRSALTGSSRRGGDLLVADVFGRDSVNGVLGNVGSMIAHPFEVARDEH